MPLQQPEAFVFAKLSTTPSITDHVQERIFPVIPTQDTDLPFLVYVRSDTEPVTHLGGVSSLARVNVTVDYWAHNFAELVTIGQAVKAALHGTKGDAIQGCFLQTHTTEEEPEAFHGQQVFALWTTE